MREQSIDEKLHAQSTGQRQLTTHPVLASTVCERVGDVEGDRDDVARETQIRVGGPNLGQRLAARHDSGCNCVGKGILVVSRISVLAKENSRSVGETVDHDPGSREY